jgi:cytochrome aa3-600 menaquinol oxidase subunit I
MVENANAPAHFFVTGNPLIYGADAAIVLVILGIVFTLTKMKRWKWLWRDWLTTVDHKKIGIMYFISAILMLFRGGVDALLMRIQLAVPNNHFLDSEHYNQIFTTHGTIMILFVAMPLIFAFFNIVVPLQIGARDVAYPFLNAVSFWLFFFGAMLFNLSFIIGGSPDAGWTAYPPLSGLEFDSGPGQNFYIMGLSISGIGSLATGINFIVTILKMRAPGMRLMDMPLFTWSVLSSCLTILIAFPVLTVALALLAVDRLMGGHFFTMLHGGNPMLFINLFWMWGHPEVYIAVLPAFGIFSEVVSTFSRKKIFGYKSMVFSMILISVVSYFTWAHHFFTMGAGADVNAFFAISTMAIGIPTGVKIFNWLFTMFRGRIEMTQAMLWTVGFILCFVVAGATGVMLSVAPADYQFHNSYFLVAHFHQALIGGAVFGLFAGMYYWFPKMFGVILSERLGKWAFWLWNIGFYVCFMPQYALGFMGMTRRVYTYGPEMGWADLNMVSTIGGFLMGIGFLFQGAQLVLAIFKPQRDLTGDPWNGRTLEWSLPSPAPLYNFAVLPQVHGRDAWFEEKKEMQKKSYRPKTLAVEDIHMPKNTGIPFVMSFFFFLAGFGLTMTYWWLGVVGLIGIGICLYARSFASYEAEYWIPAQEVIDTEKQLRTGGAGNGVHTRIV